MQIGDIRITSVNNGKGSLIIPASGTTATAPLDCQGQPPLALVTPSTWLAGNISFQVLPFLLPGVQYTNNIPTNAQLATLYDQTDSGTSYKITTVAGYGYYRLPPILFNSVRYINITSSVAQPLLTVSLVLTGLWKGLNA